MTAGYLKFNLFDTRVSSAIINDDDNFNFIINSTVANIVSSRTPLRFPFMTLYRQLNCQIASPSLAFAFDAHKCLRKCSFRLFGAPVTPLKWIARSFHCAENEITDAPTEAPCLLLLLFCIATSMLIYLLKFKCTHSIHILCLNHFSISPLLLVPCLSFILSAPFFSSLTQFNCQFKVVVSIPSVCLSIRSCLVKGKFNRSIFFLFSSLSTNLNSLSTSFLNNFHPLLVVFVYFTHHASVSLSHSLGSSCHRVN